MSWLTRHLQIDQLMDPAPRPSPTGRPILPFLPGTARLHRLMRQQGQQHQPSLPPQPQLPLGLSVPIPEGLTITAIGPEQPPPPYSALFPDGPPMPVLQPQVQLERQESPRSPALTFASLDFSDRSLMPPPPDRRDQRQGQGRPGPTRARARRQQQITRHITIYEHYNIGVDPSRYTTTRIETSGANHFYMVLPRENDTQVHVVRDPQSPRSSRSPRTPRSPASRATPSVISVSDEDTPDYTSPLLHRLPSMGDTENRAARFYIGEDTPHGRSVVTRREDDN